MNKLVFTAIGFIFGAAIGGSVSYILTKNDCEKRAQNAINEMRDYYNKKEIKKNESELSFNDKPPITEFANIFSSDINNNDEHTIYHSKGLNENTTDEEAVDKTINSIKDKLLKSSEDNLTRYSVINKSEYIAKMNARYDDRDYRYVVEEETWYDEISGSEVDIVDLPFDPGIVEWDDLDQCYICDEHGHYVYMLEKVEE